MQEVEAQKGKHITAEAYSVLFFSAELFAEAAVEVVPASAKFGQNREIGVFRGIQKWKQ